MHVSRYTTALLVAALPFLAGCAGLQPKAADPSILRVGVTANNPPMVYKEGGRIVGLEADFARALAADMGRTARFHEYKWEDLIPSLEAGHIDVIMSGMSVTQLRALRVNFSDAYLQVGQIAMIRRTDNRTYPFSQAVQFSKGRIGVEKGTTGDLFVQERCRQAERITFSSPDKAVQALIKGRIDVFVQDAPVIWRLAAENEASGVMALGPALTEEWLAWAFRKSDRELRDAANASLASWGSSGRLKRMVDDWMPFAGQ